MYIPDLDPIGGFMSMSSGNSTWNRGGCGVAIGTRPLEGGGRGDAIDF